jgi:hypothetical protein
MRRRDLMLLLGSAMTVPRTLPAQQKAMPVNGYLNSGCPLSRERGQEGRLDRVRLTMPCSLLFLRPGGKPGRGYDASAIVAVRMSALRLSAAIRPSMPWLFRIAANSERRVATSLIAPSR